jgi:hypothetical protein
MITLSLRLVHLVFMATWIGAVMFITGDVKRSLAGGTQHHDLLQDRMRRSLRLANLSAIVTIGTGFALIDSVGGMGAVSPAIHSGMTLALLAWLAAGVGIGGAWKKIVSGLDQGQDLAALAPLLKRLKISAMVFQSLWIVTLVLMVFRSQMG